MRTKRRDLRRGTQGSRRIPATFAAFVAFGASCVAAAAVTGTATLATVASPAAASPGTLTVTSISPKTGPVTGGTTVVIRGTDLTAVTRVRFGNDTATFLNYTATTHSITAVTPAEAQGSVTVSVTTPTPGGTTVTAITRFTFTGFASPTVFGVAPSSGPVTGDTQVTLTGKHLSRVTHVIFGTTSDSSLFVTNPGVITAYSPAHAPGQVTLSLDTETSTHVTLTQTFTYTTAVSPMIATLTPAFGPVAGGTIVTIHGTHLATATAVTFGGVPVQSKSNDSATSITVVSPVHASGKVSVFLKTPNGTVTKDSGFSYIPPAPTISKVTPARGSAAGGPKITVVGTNFETVKSVTVGATTAPSFMVTNATTMSVVTPPGTPGEVGVTVTTTGGTTTDQDAYTYVGVPTLATISPNAGSITGGTAVTLTGTNLTLATGVDFGSAPATDVVPSATGTMLTLLTPLHTPGYVTIKVITSVGMASISTGFRYGTVPGAPPNVLAIAANGAATVYWLVPTNGGLPITAFDLTILPVGGAPVTRVLKAAPGTAVQTTVSVPDQVAVTSLSDTTTYSFSVAAVNGVGAGPATRSATVTPHAGFWLAAKDGGIFSFGNATFHGSEGSKALNAPIVGMASTVNNLGYWEVASDGGLFAFGNAIFYGSMGGKHLNQPIVGMAATPTGGGYWEVASDGGIFAFGDALFHGSMGGRSLNKPIVAIAPTPTGQGYWEVASDGGIFSFGAARYYGSMGSRTLVAPIVAIAPTHDGLGYWEVASDGGIFSFGDALFHGSSSGNPAVSPVVGIAPTADAQGYWIAHQNGSVGAYGDAQSYSPIKSPLNQPIVAMAAMH